MAIITLGGSAVSSSNPFPVTPTGTQVVSGSVSVSNFPATQPVSASALPLPSGAATSANQTTEITALQTIATNTGAAVVDYQQSGTIAAVNGAVVITGQGIYSITASVTGTWSATLVAEGQLADSTWQAIPFTLIGATLPYTQSFTANANGTYLLMGGGYTNVRIRASAYTSGTVSVAMDASLSQQSTFAVQSGAWSQRAQDGVGNPLASSNTTPVGTEQALVVRSMAYNMDGMRQSYSASVTGLATAATATDFFTIFGSATRTVRVTRIALGGTQTTSGSALFMLIKRSTANSAGTAVAATAHDANNAAATAVVNSYTANPTVGTQVGTAVRTQRATIGTLTLASAEDNVVWDFGVRPAQAIVLRGAAQCLSVNLNGTTLTGGAINVYIEWTEDAS